MRPAMEICVDSRAPLVPMGSLMTCTVSTWPSKRIFSIGVGAACVLRAVVRARFPDVGHVQKRRAFQTDVDEGRLHARQHPHHLAGVDVAGQAARQRALDVQLLHGALQDEGDAGFLRRHVNQYVFVHVSSMPVVLVVAAKDDHTRAQGNGKPAWRSNCAVSYRGRPMMPEWLPSICSTNSAAEPWMP